MSTKHLDARELPAPEPLERLLELLLQSNDDDVIKMVHRHKPCALFDILKERGYEYKLDDYDSYVEITIWKEKAK